MSRAIFNGTLVGCQMFCPICESVLIPGEPKQYYENWEYPGSYGPEDSRDLQFRGTYVCKYPGCPIGKETENPMFWSETGSIFGRVPKIRFKELREKHLPKGRYTLAALNSVAASVETGWGYAETHNRVLVRFPKMFGVQWSLKVEYEVKADVWGEIVKIRRKYGLLKNDVRWINPISMIIYGISQVRFEKGKAISKKEEGKLSGYKYHVGCIRNYALKPINPNFKNDFWRKVVSIYARRTLRSMGEEV